MDNCEYDIKYCMNCIHKAISTNYKPCNNCYLGNKLESETQIKRTLKEWKQIKNIEIIDYDGFDRADKQLMEKLFTEEEFDKGSIFCTQYIKADKFKHIVDKYPINNQCVYCTDSKQLLTIEVPDITFDQYTGDDEIQVIIDRGYLRLGYTDDMQCMDHGEKIKIHYCPMCGGKL